MFENMNENPFMMPNQTGFIDIDNNAGNIDIELNQNQNFKNDTIIGNGITANPIIEPVRERIVNRTIEHVVPQE